MLLYMAARAQLVAEVIRPALAAGKIVISDRFLLANVVYQGYAGGLDVDELWRIGQTATGELEPTLTIVLDVSLEEAAKRLSRPLDRMERQGDEFNRRLRQGFLTESGRRPEQIVVIDAVRPSTWCKRTSVARSRIESGCRPETIDRRRGTALPQGPVSSLPPPTPASPWLHASPNAP